MLNNFYFNLFNRVDDDLRVQITDNALSRDLFPQDYYCLGDNENRPIKWLAIESLINKNFSPASDVVSAIRNKNIWRPIVLKMLITFFFLSSGRSEYSCGS